MRNKTEKLRIETESTLRQLYLYMCFQELASSDKDVKKLNDNAEFWLLFESSLLSNVFIGIRRLYENKNNSFNFQIFIDFCIENINDFSKESLHKRKIISCGNRIDWVNSCMENAYEPNEDDFKQLSRLVRNNSKKMKGVYTNIASQVYAHAIHYEHAAMLKTDEKINTHEIEEALLSLWHCYEQVWQLYENGRKPTVNITGYSYKQEVFDCIIKQVHCGTA